MKLLITFLLFAPSHLRADITTMGHLKNRVISMAKKEVGNIFIGRSQFLLSLKQADKNERLTVNSMQTNEN